MYTESNGLDTSHEWLWQDRYRPTSHCQSVICHIARRKTRESTVFRAPTNGRDGLSIDIKERAAGRQVASTLSLVHCDHCIRGRTIRPSITSSPSVVVDVHQVLITWEGEDCDALWRFANESDVTRQINV